MIVGTAGHVDHGKTALVRALTGVDTDRLAEEKARGISIELGYAYARLAGGPLVGFVDVPGHERFVHTMLAGASGIDFALLAVAADDGIMPQTREHLAILGLLGVSRGAVALTKTDRADRSRQTEVAAELTRLLAATPFAAAPVFPVSARTGEGIGALAGHLAQVAAERIRSDPGGRFRLAIDRAFALSGVGTVITGTVHSGQVRPGDRLVLAPSGEEVRVRSVHAQNRPAEAAVAGERCALAIPGTPRERVARGDWAVDPEIALSTSRIDVLLEGPALLEGGGALEVMLHLGTAQTSARIVRLDGPAGEASGGMVEPARFAGGVPAQLVLRRPIAAWRGDRFILRDAAGARTLGGGRVLDPFAPARYRRSPERMAMLAALAMPAGPAQMAALLDAAPAGLDLARLERSGNSAGAGAAAEAAGARRVKTAEADLAMHPAHWDALSGRVLRSLERHHAERPDELGLDATRLRRAALARLDPVLFRVLLEDLLASGPIRRSGPWIHLAGHAQESGREERVLIEALLPKLLDPKFDPPWVRDLARSRALPEPRVRSALMTAARQGMAYQVVRDLFYHPRAIRELAQIAVGIEQEEGEVRAAVFRDRTGLGRKRAIQILEFFDRVGFTRRVKEAHRIRGEHRVVEASSGLAAGVSHPLLMAD